MRKTTQRERKPSQYAIDIWRRNIGQFSPLAFSRRIKAAEALVLRLHIQKKLRKHIGCVNALSFNAGGDFLLSGSDDGTVILWKWNEAETRLHFHTGHTNNVFQAKFLPYSNDRIIITCAGDGQVRCCQIYNGRVYTSKWAQHEGRAHKIVAEPESPYIFYSCGDDGVIKCFDIRSKCIGNLFTCVSFQRGSIFRRHVNAIAIDPRRPNILAVAGSDVYTRIYDIRMYTCRTSNVCGIPVCIVCPPHLIGKDMNGITGLAYSMQSELLISYNNESIYLYPSERDLSTQRSSLYNNVPSSTSLSSTDSVTKTGPQAYKGHWNRATIKGVGFFGPKCEYVVSGSDCGRIFIWRKKDGKILRTMEGDDTIVNCIESHPDSTILASSGMEHDIKIWTPESTLSSSPVKQKQPVPDNFVIYYGNEDDDGDYDDGESLFDDTPVVSTFYPDVRESDDNDMIHEDTSEDI